MRTNAFMGGESVNDKNPMKTSEWDWQVRVGHWLMVALFIACWWTAENHFIVYHSYCAYALLAIIVFRIYWGFAGSNNARFNNFLKKTA